MLCSYFEKAIRRVFRRKIKPEMESIVDDYDDYRPFFTYWVTTVQAFILLVSLIFYGFGPFGFSRKQHAALVLVTSLSLQQVDYYEPDNFWLGPRAADLIHLGAKFTPCMRNDKLIYGEIHRERKSENETGCCVRNDYSGCVQTTKYFCSEILSTWLKWGSEGLDGPIYNGMAKRTSGPVCGQDPQFCTEPASATPHEWPDDITKWPICRTKSDVMKASEKQITCEVIGRPCCFGINGECKIMTREHCDFVKGFFHEEASLCSQVSCLEDVCGMLPFYRTDSPNQFYRLWTSLFLHAGIFHLLITIGFQMYIMRDLEKMMGPVRMLFLYLLSGIFGNLASSIFIPYRAEVGPSGSQFGLLACLIVQIFHDWNALERPFRALAKICSIAFVLFLLGTFPWVDNYAHITGFVTGVFLSLIFVPYINISPFKGRRFILIIIAAAFVLLIFITLFLFLYIFPIYKTPSFLKYFNCIPFTPHWCADQDIKVVRIDKL